MTCDCETCGRRERDEHQPGVTLAKCHECGVEVCSVCAAYMDDDRAYCRACKATAEREAEMVR